MTQGEINSAVRKLAYLKSPDKVRAGLRNAYGVNVPVERIKRILSTMPARNPMAVSEPSDRDGWEYDLRRNRYEPTVPEAPPPPREGPVFRYRAPLPKEVPAPSANPYVGLFQFKKLAASIGRDFGLTADEIIGKGRFRKLVLARLVLTKLCFKRGMSYSNIGRKMGGRDHSTILHQRDVFDAYAALYPIVQQSYDRHVRLREEAAKAREAGE